MKCLSPEQMMQLVYGEGDAETLSALQQHVSSCSHCQTEYWSLMEVHQWVSRQEQLKPAPAPIILKPGRTLYQRLRGGLVAAALLIAVVSGAFRLHTVSDEMERLQARNHALDQQLQQAQYRMDQSHRDQYMLMMALKDYMDQNLTDRRVSYVPRP